MTDKELEQLQVSDNWEWDDPQRVAVPREKRQTVISVSLRRDQSKIIAEAAERAGESRSEFIRNAALKRASSIMTSSREQISKYVSEPMSDEDVTHYIDQHIDKEAFGLGIANAKIRGTGTSVAAVIISVGAGNGDLERAADDYHLTTEQVLAAVYFYWRYQGIIDTEITVRVSGFMD